ncbi:MAG: response regulator transcription factor [Deltaproteobacteria bacterium]|nr:response regulator transcription factor [Deltaproteobacteria bacterium]
MNNSRAKPHARRKTSQVRVRATEHRPARAGAETPTEEAHVERSGRAAPYVLIVDPDADERAWLISGLRGGREPGDPEDDLLPIRAAASVSRVRELLRSNLACAALICGPGLETLDARRLLELGAREGATLRLLVGAAGDAPRQASASEQLAVYLSSPADPATLQRLARRLLSNLRLAAAHEHVERLDLTPRQRELLLLLVDGLRARQVCLHLDITHSTYRKHVGSILATTGFQRTVELLASFERSA